MKLILNSGTILELFGVKLEIISYADDTVLICSSLEALQNALSIIEKYCLEHKIKINESKTEWIAINEKKNPKNEL